MSVMSVWTSPPGGVSPGASRWSAAPADDGEALCTSSAARTSAPARAISTASPSVRLFANRVEVMPSPFWVRMDSLVLRRVLFAAPGDSVRADVDRTDSRGPANQPANAWTGGDAMRRRRVLVGAAAAGVAAAVVLLGGVFSGSPGHRFGGPSARAAPTA